MDAEQIPVPIGACLCPDTPHTDGDEVYLRSKLGLAAGTTLQRRIVEANQERADNAELTGRLAESYLLIGVVGWNLVDAKGKPVPVTPETIKTHLLDDFERSAPVADAADALYMGPVLLPLVKKVAESSTITSINGSTSPASNGSRRSRKRPKRSSTTTTRTADTVAISA
jgi:hypothetical protein